MKKLKKGDVTKARTVARTVPLLGRRVLAQLEKNPYGLRASTISKLCGLCRSVTYKHLKQLKDLGLAENCFPVWRNADDLEYPSKLSHATTQLHNLSFTIKLVRKPEWWDTRKDKIMKLRNLDLQLIKWGKCDYSQIRRDDFLIQFHKYSIIVINQRKYWGKDAYECLEQGARDFLAIYHFIEDMFRFRFFENGVPQVTVRSNHYVSLKDAVAWKCKKTGQKFEVLIDGKLALWVDFSDPMGLESNSPELIQRIQRYYKDFAINEPATNSELEQTLKALTHEIAQITVLLTPQQGKDRKPPTYIG